MALVHTIICIIHTCAVCIILEWGDIAFIRILAGNLEQFERDRNLDNLHVLVPSTQVSHTHHQSTQFSDMEE